jgi:uncharacterized membrane protein
MKHRAMSLRPMRHRTLATDRRTWAATGALTVVAVAAGAAWVASRNVRWTHDGKRRPDMPALSAGRGARVERTVTILRSPEALYESWRDLARLPQLMSHLESVTPLDERHSRWVARGPGGTRITWEAEITADEPGRLIAWRSVNGADIENAGSVRFTPAPGGRGTEVKVLLSYELPAGRLGEAAVTLLGESGDQEVREDLRRFKQKMETGEVATGARRLEDPR